jgi:hypothetical protein
MALSISALAVASPHANAVGAVRLICEPHQLIVELVHVGGFTAGFSPGAVVKSHTIRVPYAAVRGLVRRGRTLCLALDPARTTPHNRFALTRFSEAPPESLLFAYRARAWTRVLAIALPLPLGAAAALLAPRSMASGAVGLTSFGALIALAAYVLLRELVAIASWGGPSSDRCSEALEAELANRLGLTAATTTQAESPVVARTSVAPAGTWLGIALASATLVGAFAFVQRFAKEVTVPPRVPPVAAGLANRARAVVSSLPHVPEPASLSSCRCARPDSPLWRAPLPSLSVLLIDRDGGDAIAPSVDHRGAARYDFDVAAVNNTDQTLHDVRIVITFAQRSKTHERIRATDRGLYVEALGPGRARKWRVRGPGTELRVDQPKLPPIRWRSGEDLPSGAVEAAPVEAFHKLLSANQPRVRAHGAMMLAYLRDERAEDAALELSGASPSGERYRQSIVRAAGRIMACEVTAQDRSFTVCITNDSDRQTRGVLQAIADDGTQGREVPWPAPVPAHEGRRLTFQGFEGALLPADLVARE